MEPVHPRPMHEHWHVIEDVSLGTMHMPAVMTPLQAEEASDQVIVATEEAEDLNLSALEQELESKHGALNQASAILQQLQASLLH